MKNKHPSRKRILGKSRRFFFTFLAGAIFISSLFTLSLAVTHDLSPTMDERLFQGVKEKGATCLYYYDGENAVEWEEARVTPCGECVYTPLEEMPEYLKNAFIAMEDHRFYRHAGVDVIRTAKAVFNRLLGEKKRFGGSTITQQLIKNIGGEREKTVKRKAKEIKAKQVKVVVKEIRFGPQTDDHDYNFKLKHAENFIKEGAKVKASVFFRGRSIVFKEQGEILLLRFATDLEEIAKVEMMPKLDGKKMNMILAPKSKK